MPQKALLLLHEGCEEIEAVTPADLLRRAGIEVVLASAGPERLVRGGRGIVLQADRLLHPGIADDFEVLILPGGPGISALRGDARVLDLVRAFHAAGKWIAAICAAPLLLLDAGVAADHVLTSFPSEKAELAGAVRAYVEDRVVRDGVLLTARGAGASEEFSLALIALLLNPEAAEEVRRRIVAR